MEGKGWRGRRGRGVLGRAGGRRTEGGGWEGGEGVR